jgi:hypothetical protein
MGNISIIQELKTAKENNKAELKWEKECFEIGCMVSRQEYLKRLGELEERLFLNHPRDLEVEGFKERTRATNFGEVTIQRRLYKNKHTGDYHFLLDEYLEWPPYQLATPDLQEYIVDQAAQAPFRVANQNLKDMTAVELSLSTTYRLVQKTAQRVIQKEEKDWQAIYSRGELLPGGEYKVPILFCEGDGTWIHLQQEEQLQYEIKDGIAYEGWERLPGEEERYALVNKRVYCQANAKVPFWEGASLEWSRVWDLSYPKEIIIGGDGASWIDQGIEEFVGAIRQLDGFHLARASNRGWQEGKAIYQAIRAGKTEEACKLMVQANLKEGKGAVKSRSYVENNLEKGSDWRTQSETEGRGLGTMESNQDKLICNRMAKRGLSWKIEGALRMAKVLQLRANGEIKPWCRRQPSMEKKVSATIIQTLARSNKPQVEQRWLQAGIPALVGPHSSRPWAKKLRNLTNLSYRLN